jgi:hypothetical protein
MSERIKAAESFSRSFKNVLGNYLTGLAIDPELIKPTLENMGGLRISDPAIPWLKALLLPGMGKVRVNDIRDDSGAVIVRYNTQNDEPSVMYNELSVDRVFRPEFYMGADRQIFQDAVKAGVHVQYSGSCMGSYFSEIFLPPKTMKDALKMIEEGQAGSYFGVKEAVMVDFPTRLRQELAGGDRTKFDHIPSHKIIVTKVEPIDRGRFGFVTVRK